MLPAERNTKYISSQSLPQMRFWRRRFTSHFTSKTDMCRRNPGPFSARCHLAHTSSRENQMVRRQPQRFRRLFVRDTDHTAGISLHYHANNRIGLTIMPTHQIAGLKSIYRPSWGEPHPSPPRKRRGSKFPVGCGYCGQYLRSFPDHTHNYTRQIVPASEVVAVERYEEFA